MTHQAKKCPDIGDCQFIIAFAELMPKPMSIQPHLNIQKLETRKSLTSKISTQPLAILSSGCHYPAHKLAKPSLPIR